MKSVAATRRLCAMAALAAAQSAFAVYEVPDAAYNAPTHYYDAATGTGLTLRANLHAIISAGFTSRNYGLSRWNMGTGGTDSSGSHVGGLLDIDPANPSDVLLVYNRASVAGTWDTDSTTAIWNREHVWPKKWLNLTSDDVTNSYSGPASDSFELRPADKNINSSRNDNGYGLYPATSGTYKSLPSPFGINGAYWYPGVADTGDVARTIFYMATRYFDPTNSSRGTSIQNLEIVNGTPSVYNMGDLNSLLHWNYSDGVDNFERRRNQLIYGSSGDLTNHALNPSYYQGNRNPFIDHPEYVWAVFGGGVNNSQISVGGAPAADGSSATTVDLGRAIVGSALPTGSVVVNKAGADPTTFDVTASGVNATAGSALQVGTGQPFDYNAGSKTMSFTLAASTGTVGVKSGTITVNNTDLTSSGAGHGSADGNDVVNVTATVVDHSNGSFASLSDVNTQSIDFGYVPQGFAARTAGFSVANLTAASGYTADLALNSIGISGSSSFSTDVTTFSHLAAGMQNSYVATLDTSTAGVQSAVQTLSVSDEAIPGATANTSLALTINARVLSSATFPVTGFIQLNSDETYTTGAFSIAAGQTLSKTGAGVMNITGVQSNGAGSSLIVTNGAVTMTTDAGSRGAFPLALSASGATITLLSPEHLASLTVGNNAVVTVSAGGGNVLVANALSVESLGKLDLNDNDAIVGVTPGNIVSYLHSGRAGGDWNGNGVTSSTAANDPHHLKAIGWAPESVVGSTFDGETVSAAALVLKYTSYGDANLDGTISADDYALIDRGMAGGLSGWVAGDFDYSGTVDAGDYLLIDEAYGFQTGVLSPGMLADRESRFGDGYVQELAAAVPEPGMLSVGVVMLMALHRRRTANA